MGHFSSSHFWSLHNYTVVLKLVSKYLVYPDSFTYVVLFLKHISPQCTEVRFSSLLSGGFTTMELINPTGIETGKTHVCALCTWYFDPFLGP